MLAVNQTRAVGGGGEQGVSVDEAVGASWRARKLRSRGCQLYSRFEKTWLSANETTEAALLTEASTDSAHNLANLLASALAFKEHAIHVNHAVPATSCHSPCCPLSLRLSPLPPSSSAPPPLLLYAFPFIVHHYLCASSFWSEGVHTQLVPLTALSTRLASQSSA